MWRDFDVWEVDGHSKKATSPPPLWLPADFPPDVPKPGTTSTGRFRERKPVLVAASGTLTMICYISITLTILQPFQCTQNPNGLWTTRAYEDVICWSMEENSDHLIMVVVSVIALSIPLALFTKVVLLVRKYPTAMRRGDTDFLRSYGFVFFRFRPKVHHFRWASSWVVRGVWSASSLEKGEL